MLHLKQQDLALKVTVIGLFGQSAITVQWGASTGRRILEVGENLRVSGALGVFEELAVSFGGGIEIEDGVSKGDGTIDLTSPSKGFEC